ncbi:MAG: Monofunctional biosynthetic peptidoglycan transglycosylase [Pseudomonadota bacterium]|jgi:monofunctional biosynthetic peptidoglycan transglycosylase
MNTTTANSNHNQRSWFSRLWQLGYQLLFGFIIISIISVVLLRWLPAPTSMFMLYRHSEDLIQHQHFIPIRYSWVNYANISLNASAAVIASEDQHFFNHSGFDTAAIQMAIQRYLKGGQLRGASTISQQVAKNLFLTPTKSFIRKGIEAWFTFLIEIFWTKQRILEMYLNIAELGDHVFGINEASYKYFSISPRQLTVSQAALLAATLPNPIIYQAQHPSRYVLKRQKWILRQMRNNQLFRSAITRKTP